MRTIPTGQLRLLVFDLDGTLIDSRRDLVESVNATLRQLGLARQQEDQIASYIGDGAKMLVERALVAAGADLAVLPAALEAFLDYYRVHKLDHTLPYPGVVESLQVLRERMGLPMAVLTNKPVNPSRQICEGLGLAQFFFQIYGGNSFPTKKPDPAGLHMLMREANATANATVLFGDSSVDIRTAGAAGSWSVGCRYGLAPRSIAEMETLELVDVVVDSASEWSDAFQPG